MARNLVVNGVTYNGVESLEIPDDAGETIPYVELPDLTNPGAAESLLEGTQLIDADGKVIEGTMPENTMDDVTVNGNTISIPKGYYPGGGKFISTQIPSDPSISVDTNGLITATMELKDGYVSAATKKSTKQLSTIAEKTVTPTKSVQTAAAAGRYTTGAIQVGAIPDQYQDVTPVTATDDHVFAGDVFVDAQGNPVPGTFTLEEEVNTQDALISRIKAALQGKISGLPTQEKTVEITGNGNVDVSPDDGYTLSKVAVLVNVPVPDGYIQPSGILEVAENGTHDVTQYASVNVNVEASGGASEYYTFVNNTILDLVICDHVVYAGATADIPVDIAALAEIGAYILVHSLISNVVTPTGYTSIVTTVNGGAPISSRIARSTFYIGTYSNGVFMAGLEINTDSSNPTPPASGSTIVLTLST